MVKSKKSKLVTASEGSGSSGGIDRISNLPEPLISHILSLLPTKCAVATSVLSTRWKYLWTPITNLDFDSYVKPGSLSKEARIMKRSKFTHFVNRVLLLLNPPSIQNFRLNYSQELYEPSYINSWLCVALRRTVQTLDLFLSLVQIIELPLSHISCNVVVLNLKGHIHFNVPAAASICFANLHTLQLYCTTLEIANNSSISFPNLKILHLSYVDYENEDSVHKLFSSCPVLDDLVILREDWDNVLCLIIRIPSLRRHRLKFVFHCMEGRAYKLQIDTPALQHLNLEDDIPCEYLPTEHLCSLLQAKVRLSYNDAEDVERCLNIFKFIERLSKVKLLSVSDCAMMAIRTVSANFTSGFHNLTRLELEEHNCVDSPILINNFLGMEAWIIWNILS